jgi:hypothetical protein
MFNFSSSYTLINLSLTLPLLFFVIGVLGQMGEADMLELPELGLWPRVSGIELINRISPEVNKVTHETNQNSDRISFLLY